MKKTRNIGDDNPLNVLDNIEENNVILSKQERSRLEEMFESIDDFNLIYDFIEEKIVKSGISENDLLQTYNIITKINQNRAHPKTVEKMSLTRSFFELPEILSKRIRTRL